MTTSHGHGRDRLSALPDSMLVRVLSQLASDEAVHSSALSRRWLDVHEAVPIVNLVDTKKGERCGGADLKVCFDQQVTSVILSKGMTTPIRAFRLSVQEPPYDLLDQWIATVVTSGVEDLDVKLRYNGTCMRTLCPLASADLDAASEGYTQTHRRIFSCPTLSRLRLKNWTLDLPTGGVVMESLVTLCLARIMDPDGMLQQLVSSCPCLADLMLQECPSIEEITVPSPRLWSFAMICCHNASSVELNSTCVQSLHYKGSLPPHGSSFFTVANYQGVKAVTIEICENLCTKGLGAVAPVTGLIRRCTKLTYLHLSLRPAMAFYSSTFTSVLRDDLRSLTHLSLQGCLPTDHAVQSVVALLLNTRNIEVLSFFPLGPEPPKEASSNFSDGETDSDLDGESDTDPNGQPDTKPDGAANNGVKYSIRIPKSLWRKYVRCLDRSVTRINIGNYQGQTLEKMLARFLLSRAAALEEFSVTLAAGLYPQKDEIGNELASWRWNCSTRVTCTNKLQRRKI